MDILEDMLNCAICTNTFECSGERLPKMLPCQHSFCVKCLENVRKNESIRCPICRSNYKSAVDQLPQNLLLIQMIDAMPKPSKHIEHDIEKLKLVGGSSDDDENDEEGSSSEEDDVTITKNKIRSMDYTDPDIATGLLRSVLILLKKSEFDEDNLGLVLDCMRHYRETKNTVVLEEAAECLGYMRLHFLHKIPKIYYKKIAQEVLDTLETVRSSTKLRTSCVYVLYAFARVKYQIFDELSAITILFDVYDVENDTGVLEQGIVAIIRLLGRKLTADDKQTLSTTDHVRKLICVLIKKIDTECYDSTLNDALAISLGLIASDESQRYFTNHGALCIALLLEVENLEKHILKHCASILKKLSEVPELCTKMIAFPKLTSNLQLHLNWEDKDYIQVTYDVISVITNLLQVPKSQWKNEEETGNKYDTLAKGLSSLFTSKTMTQTVFDNVSEDLLMTLYPQLIETSDEAAKHFAIIMMLNLCLQEEGNRYKSLILQAKERDVIRKLAGNESSVSEELKKIAVQLENLLETFDTQSDE